MLADLGKNGAAGKNRTYDPNDMFQRFLAKRGLQEVLVHDRSYSDHFLYAACASVGTLSTRSKATSSLYLLEHR